MASLDDELMDLIAEEALIDRARLNRIATLADVGLDSVDVVSVVFAVEEKYGVHIAEDALTKITNLGELLDTFEAAIEKQRS
jgi:acyl carrier protein